ncbi:MAG: leucine-rich repeat protein [Raoultibacter sp.]
MQYKMVFQDSTTELADIVDQVNKNPLNISAEDAHEYDSPKASAQEVWSPQLLPYKSWAVQETTADREEVGLLEAGSLGLGLSQDIREATLARAARQQILSDAHERNEDACDNIQREPILSVRLDEDGYAIVGIDLHAYEHHCGSKVSNTVIIIPRSIGDTPIVRIAAGAFARRLVYGIDVRLVVVPDSVTHIEGDAFAALSVHDIFISRSVKSIGPQHFSIKKATYVPDHIAFHVDKDNPVFSEHEGSLYSKSGDTLYFQAFPAQRTLTLPDTLRYIAPNAFIEDIDTPECIICPPSLSRIGSIPNPYTLWVCSTDAALRTTLANKHLLALAPNYVYADGFYFDITESGEAHLARSPRVSEQISLPSSVEGKPLTRIRIHALPHRIETLIIPDTVTVIEAKNTCVGLKELTLPAHLHTLGAHNFLSRALIHPLTIPRSVTSVGRGCFENCVCYLEACETTVHISPNLQLSCFIGEDAPPADEELYAQERIPFDFQRYDELLTSSHYLFDKLGAIMHRIEHPFRMSPEARHDCLTYLQDHHTEAMRRAAQAGNPQLLESLCTCGFITAETIDEQTELLRQMRKTDCVLFLMDYRQKHFRAATETPSSRFAL